MFAFYIGSTALVFVIVIFTIFSYCWMSSKLNRAFNEIKMICTRYSVPNTVSYALRDEWWGGCSKPNVRRRFLIVRVGNVDGVGGDVEGQNYSQQQLEMPPQQQQIPMSNPAPTAPAVEEPFSQNPSSTGTTTNNGN